MQDSMKVSHRARRLIDAIHAARGKSSKSYIIRLDTDEGGGILHAIEMLEVALVLEECDANEAAEKVQEKTTEKRDSERNDAEGG